MLLVQLVVHLVVVVVMEPPPLPHQLLSPDPLDPPDQLAILVLKVMLEHPVTMVVQVVMAHPAKMVILVSATISINLINILFTFLAQFNR